MNTLVYRLLFALTLTTLLPLRSAAVVGYYPYQFYAGDNLFQNNLQNIPNDLTTMFSPTTTPNGSRVSLWSAATLSYDTSSTFQNGSWSVDLTLSPGTGARLTAPVNFINIFVGEVLDHNGSPYNGVSTTLPPPYSGPNGAFLLGDKFPASSSGSTAFANVMGRTPNDGDQIIRLDASSHTYITSTYQGGTTQWDITPTIDIGESVFFNIGGVPFTPPALTTVPEPSVVGLALLGLAVCRRNLRGRHRDIRRGPG